MQGAVPNTIKGFLIAVEARLTMGPDAGVEELRAVEDLTLCGVGGRRVDATGKVVLGAFSERVERAGEQSAQHGVTESMDCASGSTAPVVTRPTESHRRGRQKTREAA
jgi:hypothetical protein